MRESEGLEVLERENIKQGEQYDKMRRQRATEGVQGRRNLFYKKILTAETIFGHFCGNNMSSSEYAGLL